MSDETGEVAGGEPIAVIEAPADTGTDLSVSEAGRALNAARNRKPPAESAEVATAEPELSGEDNAAPAEQATGETQEADPAEKPPLELPRSWTKDRAEHWAKLDPGTQEFLLEQDRKASAEVRRLQNEAADERKAIKVEREQAEKARQQYEAQLPALMQTLQDAQQASFGDIRTVADVERLQAEDPFRFQAWQVQQMKLQAAHAETERVNRERSQAQQSEWTNYVQKENELAAEWIPELADKDKGPALTKRVATELLPELGFKESELNDLANGKAKLSIYDHRVQRLLADAVKLRDIQKAPKAVAKPDLPPVVRPGTARPPGNAVSEQIQALTQKLNETGDLKIAQQLRALQVQRRAS
jgi:hypothetical protein